MTKVKGGFLHLGVEDAGIRLHDANGAIVGKSRKQAALAVRNNGRKSHLEILGVHLSGEAVADCLLLASGNFDSITSSSQVADDLGLIIGFPKATADKVHRDRVRLIIGDGDQRLGRVTVDKLDTEDLGSRERGLSRDSQSGNLCFSILSILQVQNQTISQLSHAT